MSQRLKSLRFAPLFTALLISLWIIPAGRTGDASHHMLWEVSGAHNTVWLMGSMHVLPEDAYPLPPLFADVFHRAKTVVFETDIDGIFSEEVNRYIAEKGYYSGNDTLWKHLDETTGEQLRQICRKLKLPGMMLLRMRPWQVDISLTQLMYQREGYRADTGLDIHFFKMAKDQDKSLKFLEDGIVQLRMVGDLPEDIQIKMLRATMEEDATIAKLTADMYLYWRTGDTVKFGKLLNEQLIRIKELREPMLDRRNRSWMPAIEGYLKAPDDVLVIVGTGHLVGENSVVDMLRRKGFTVRQR